MLKVKAFKRPTSRPSKPMTRKEIFAHVWRRFFTEESPQCRVSPEGGCRYSDHRDVQGCAVGCMLTREDAKEFDSMLSSTLIRNIYSRNPDAVGAYFEDNPATIEMLSRLQHIHDGNPSIAVRKRELQRYRTELGFD